ncbi:unnamed protein product [Ectocarpus sp. 4 AP-2014]
MKPAVVLALLAGPLASPSSARPASSPAFLSGTLGRPCCLTQRKKTAQRQRQPSSSGQFNEQRATATSLYSSPNAEEEAAAADARTPSLLITAPRPVERSLGDVMHQDDSPAVRATSTSIVDVTAAVAVVVAAFSYLALGPLDVASAATTAPGSVELVAQASTAAASVDVGAILAKAGNRALGGGASGAAAAVVQVLTLMWLRTTMNYQYKNGGSTKDALQSLWEEGGVARLYRGVSFALVQGPLSRFGDTAANVGVLALLEAFESTRSLPLPVKSAAGSLAAGLWRIGLTPIDAYKTTLQVSGAEGTKLLAEKVAANGPTVLFEGALATASATFVGHYPWYFTYNSLGAWLPPAPTGEPLLKLGRQAFLGKLTLPPQLSRRLCSSCVSDCCSNSIRVVKTTKQTAPIPLSYPEALKQVLDDDGVPGLFLRGLQTRILVNALQGALFAVAWKYFQELLASGGGP